jgi:hypothetical protein
MLHYLYILVLVIFSVRTDGCIVAAPIPALEFYSFSTASPLKVEHINKEGEVGREQQKELLQPPTPSVRLHSTHFFSPLLTQSGLRWPIGLEPQIGQQTTDLSVLALGIPNTCRTLLLFPMHHFL